MPGRRLRILAPGLNHEAHLPTQEAQASQDSRLPRPDADPRRSRRPAPPPAQGAQAPHSLSVAGVDPGGRRRRRLSRSGDFQRVYREGSSRANRYLVLYRFPRADDDRGEDGPRLGVSVGRKVGGAVQRNRVKRVLREAFWAAEAEFPPGDDYVVVARPEAAALVESEGEAGARRCILELAGGERST